MKLTWERSQGRWNQVPVTEDKRRRLPWLSLVASAAFTPALLSGSSLVTRCIATLHGARPLSCSAGKWPVTVARDPKNPLRNLQGAL